MDIKTRFSFLIGLVAIFLFMFLFVLLVFVVLAHFGVASILGVKIIGGIGIFLALLEIVLICVDRFIPS